MNARRYPKFLAGVVTFIFLATLLGSAGFPTSVRAARLYIPSALEIPTPAPVL
jgi:hypothetical protein